MLLLFTSDIGMIAAVNQNGVGRWSSGVLVSLSRRRSRVQIPSAPPLEIRKPSDRGWFFDFYGLGGKGFERVCRWQTPDPKP